VRFLCLAYGAEKDWKLLSRTEQDALLAEDAKLQERGALMGAVEPQAVTVTAWDGQIHMLPGAFARHEIPLAGFSIIEAESLEAAAQMVAGTPCARARGAIEIRPVLAINEFAVGRKAA
jgi:hypothetical protein